MPESPLTLRYPIPYFHPLPSSTLPGIYPTLLERFVPIPSHVFQFLPSELIPVHQTVIVTGANTGIGYHTVRQLLLKNAKVYLAARSLTKSEEAAVTLEKEIGRRPLQLQIDLGDLHSVKRAAQEFLSKEDKLDILFNNALVFNFT